MYTPSLIKYVYEEEEEEEEEEFAKQLGSRDADEIRARAEQQATDTQRESRDGQRVRIDTRRR